MVRTVWLSSLSIKCSGTHAWRCLPATLRSFHASSSSELPRFGSDLHEYTSGRWLFNEKIRLKERSLDFNAHELANVICSTLNRPCEDLYSLEKFAEGGFNRILQATFNDGKQILARIPYRLEAPLERSVSSEAATLSFLHQHDLPVPKVLAYSAVSNPAGIEYILLEKLPGRPLGEQWFSLDNKTVAKVMKQIVDLEQKYMGVNLPASGSLYFEHDLPPSEHFVSANPPPDSSAHFVVGPISSYAWDYRERARLCVDRGPWRNYRTCFEAAAKRELAYCQRFGEPRHNVERYLRELDALELQRPEFHTQLLQDYLCMAPHLDIPQGHALERPTLRHPDLSPNNVLVDDEYNIVGLIDWQHTAILPLCLCAGIPKYFQNYGDPVSESLEKPNTRLPKDFDTLNSKLQEAFRDKMRRQLVHFYYAALTMKKVESHFDAFRNTSSTLRAKLYSRAGAPWEGSSLALEHTLVEAQQRWPLPLSGLSNTVPPICPVHYSAERIQICLGKVQEEDEKLEELQDMRNMLGIDALGWVENEEHLMHAKEMREVMRSAFLKEAETDLERTAVNDHFAFHDHDE